MLLIVASISHKVSTPRAGQFHLILSEGSKVWLNASSSLRFPADLGGGDRVVELDGEGYFEVTEMKGRPFKVKLADGTLVEVLGTHFNVNAYRDESFVRTTLLEGKVRVSKNGTTALLKPNEQAKIQSDGLLADGGGGQGGSLLTVERVDVGLAVAWKNGYTAFKSADIKSIMRLVARWYDVEVVYEGAVPDRRFSGEVSRNAQLSEVLKIMEASDIRFRMEGRKLVVGG